MTDYIKRKSLLNRSGVEWTDYNCNHYVGCAHDCSYCYARILSHKEHCDWRKVSVVENAMELAVKEIKALPSKARIMVSSMTDPYQPIEETEKLTRGLLPVLASREDVQVILITKSDLVARDFNLISEFPNVKLCMTVTSLNSLEEFEPYAPSNGRRIMCLQVAHEQGIYTIASIEPWLPHVTEPLILVKMMCAYVDEFFIGSWNHHFRQGSEEEKKTMQIYKRQLPEVLEFLHNHMKKVVVKKELSEMTRG